MEKRWCGCVEGCALCLGGGAVKEQSKALKDDRR